MVYVQIPQISVIVPMFNAVATLQRCVTSIKNQTFNNWELLMVDDGSSDGTLELARNLAQSDERIKLLNQSHQGVSAARNMAISLARGNYVCFVDADDYIEPDYLDTLFLYREYDMVIVGYYVDVMDNEGRRIKQNIYLPEYIDLQSFDDKSRLLALFMAGMIHLNCNKLLHMDIIRDHSLCYSGFPVNEDYLFMVDYLSYCNCIVTIRKPLYHWIRIAGLRSGVDSMPENLLEIYNQAQLKTRKFFGDDAMADVTQYYSYCYLIQKYFKAFNSGMKNKTEVHSFLRDFHRNELVKASFSAYKPTSRGEWVMHMLLKFGCFRTHQLLGKFFEKLWTH